MAPPPRFVLASQSPARLALLRAAGIEPEVIVSGVDEASEETDPHRLADLLARRKALAVVPRIEGEALVLGCDSVFSHGGGVYGKPANAVEAITRWRRMRGTSGVLVTGHALVRVAPGRRTMVQSATVATTVHFAQVSDTEVGAYVATGEPLRVAGGFTLDGLAAPFIEGVEGDPSNVIGLSLPTLRSLLALFEVPITALWRAR